MARRQGALVRLARDAWGYLFGERVVARADSRFGVATVRDLTWEGERLRVLEVDGTYQSATYLDERYTVPPFPYLRLFGRLFELDPAPRDLLMLGGGALAFPKYAIAHDPSSVVDVVEVDATVLALARDHFLLDRLEADFGAQAEGRLNVYCEDARAFLERARAQGRRYDAILVDCFCAGESDATLQDTGALACAHACLNRGGVVAFNQISALTGPGAEGLREFATALSGAFAHAAVLSEGRLDDDVADNRCVVASDIPIALTGQLTLF